MEVGNAVTQATKEITQRYDFKGLKVSIELDSKQHTLTLAAPDDFKIAAIWDVLQGKLVRRKVPLKNLKPGDIVPAAGGSVRQVVAIQNGLTPDMARAVVRAVKDAKMKRVQAAIQGEAVRVSSPSKDDLQAAIVLLKQQDLGVELRFENYRTN